MIRSHFMTNHYILENSHTVSFYCIRKKKKKRIIRVQLLWGEMVLCQITVTKPAIGHQHWLILNNFKQHHYCCQLTSVTFGKESCLSSLPSRSPTHDKRGGNDSYMPENAGYYRNISTCLQSKNSMQENVKTVLFSLVLLDLPLQVVKIKDDCDPRKTTSCTQGNEPY